MGTGFLALGSYELATGTTSELTKETSEVLSHLVDVHIPGGVIGMFLSELSDDVDPQTGMEIGASLNRLKLWKQPESDEDAISKLLSFAQNLVNLSHNLAVMDDD